MRNVLRHAPAAGLALFVSSIACQTAGIQRAYMALDGQGARKRTAFYTDTQQIWCDVDYSSGRKDLTIDATIRATSLYDPIANAVEPIDVVIAQGEAVGQTGTGNTVGFQWTQVDTTGSPASAGSVPYPVGDFVCELSLDGQVMATLPFTVSFPACPVPPVADKLPCLGWVAPNSACPDALGLPCVCRDGVWTC
jgi:hypothetical protein